MFSLFPWPSPTWLFLFPEIKPRPKKRIFFSTEEFQGETTDVLNAFMENFLHKLKISLGPLYLITRDNFKGLGNNLFYVTGKFFN